MRRAGSPDAQAIDSRTTGKALEQSFLNAALQARDADPAAFLTSLDAAAQAAALHPGKRLLVAVLNSPPLSSEGEQTLQTLVDVCRAHAVRVIVLDIDPEEHASPNTSLESLARRTGGKLLRQAKALDGSVTLVAPAEAGEAFDPTVAATPAPVGANAGTQFPIPVHTRFIRTSTTGGVSGTMDHFVGGSANSNNLATGERPREANDATGPMRGLLLAEAPLNALKFETDPNAGTYLARARIFVAARNARGDAVWTGQKEVSIRGPLRKLDSRQLGSLLFLRSVTLPKGERYTLEARVQDLLAGGAGVVQTPLRTGQGVPGLMASDALFVRPFLGSADKFEADQVFAYDGEALSPILDPVFRAEDPINLQIYFIVYPDTKGAPPELSLELSREGRVIARMPMQFKTELRNTALEGKFGTLAGKSISIMGGSPHEFPYLANMKGARLTPGSYDAVITVRQGRSVIQRDVAFRVIGNAPALVASTGGALGTPSDADNADVVLPEIEPATLDSSGLRMDTDHQKQLWDAAAGNAREYSSHLPNFRCSQETHRFTAPIKVPDQLKEADSFKDELTYEDGKESYRTIEINGAKVDTTRGELKGVHSQGEFGSMLRGLFDPDMGATYKWAGRAMAMGVLCQVFDIEVPRAKSNFSLNHRGRRELVGYTGRLFVDEETGLVRRLVIQGIGLPKDFALQSPTFSLEYGMVRIGTEDYLLPLRSVLQLRQSRLFVRNEATFRGYRRFDASSEIKFEKEKEE